MTDVTRRARGMNPWALACALAVTCAYALYWGRGHMVGKRVIRAQREALRADARACAMRLTTMEHDLFESNKAKEGMSRELDSLKREHELRVHQLFEAQGELEARKMEASAKQMTNDSNGDEANLCRNELKEAKFQIERLRHEKVGLELDVQRAKHEAAFSREHIKEELIKEDVEAIEKLIDEDIKRDVAREAAGDIDMDFDMSDGDESENAAGAADSKESKEHVSEHQLQMEKTQYGRSKRGRGKAWRYVKPPATSR